MLIVVSMKSSVSCARIAALILFLPAAVAVLAQSQPATLKQVEVSASRAAGPRDAQPFGTSVITAEEIERAGAVTVNDALIRLLGVVGRQDFFGGGDYALDLRGFGVTSDSNQVVIVDGIRISEADLGGTRLAGIPIESVVQIEVIRGSGAVLYGEGATGGVIIITTNAGKGVPKKCGLRVCCRGQLRPARRARQCDACQRRFFARCQCREAHGGQPPRQLSL